MSTPLDVGTTRGRVFVVGAINVDLVVAAERLPGPGETVVGTRVERYGGGKGANAAVAAARAGAEVHLVGAVGADANGTEALDELTAEGIWVDGVTVLEDEATGVALIVVDPGAENQIAVGAGANAALSAEHVTRALASHLRPSDSVLVSTEIPDAAVEAAVIAAASAGARCVLNPAPPIPGVADLLGYGPILTPNAGECLELAKMLDDDHTHAREAAAAIMARTGAPVVVTLGGDGALVLTPDGNVDHVRPRPAVARDTTGAGDTFNGVLITRLAAGDELDDAVRAANVAAALSVAHVGARAGMPRATDIEVGSRA
ncbi:PfkB family carbohydrate kinase [Rhodococcus opacus]|uniref:Ribokinase n=1 Tax=Rhodococcus opacus TaxID=37919 RepID=A0AAX3YE52_RHOOP|nr:PfkB family carbohydrate kinase [Rhodococcus opacus]MCZ4587848.1 PfkB family carbohydrate kinase [Rhodococcus opacus]MDJ0417713.1 PfkB family carbohydrate kinase [Rhodococcus opacus]MDV6242196.1 PfkB family carbohydrate kinase [Rhodococcus opacus]MDX5967716.1 PfkB family carbohydrate kinase [Rhodococcus opacus]NKY76417.1 ribokinase [Rhodococcus opacus]